MESKLQNVVQTAYQIRVFRGEQCVWDSLKRGMDQSTFVFYEGGPLQSSTRYRWTVTVWDNFENSESAEAYFETARLRQGDWKAVWVEADIKHGKRTPAVMFRKVFQAKAGLVSARVYATCHGVYQIHINGRQADARKFAPEHTVYEECLYYQTYDVTGLMNEGWNAIGMYVGDGWYFNMMSRKKGKNFSYRHGVLFQIELRYENGETDFVVSDGSVCWAEGPV